MQTNSNIREEYKLQNQIQTYFPNIFQQLLQDFELFFLL